MFFVMNRLVSENHHGQHVFSTTALTTSRYGISIIRLTDLQCYSEAERRHCMLDDVRKAVSG